MERRRGEGGGEVIGECGWRGQRRQKETNLEIMYW